MTDHSISFYPEYLFEDVQNTVYDVHLSGEIHKTVASNLGESSCYTCLTCIEANV